MNLAMIRRQSSKAKGAFRALSDPTRRDILAHLSLSDLTIGEVVDQFSMTRGAIKKHLTILEEGGLISVHPRGRERVNRLSPAGLKQARDWIDHFSQFWDERLGALKEAAEQAERQNSKQMKTSKKIGAKK